MTTGWRHLGPKRKRTEGGKVAQWWGLQDTRSFQGNIGDFSGPFHSPLNSLSLGLRAGPTPRVPGTNSERQFEDGGHRPESWETRPREAGQPSPQDRGGSGAPRRHLPLPRAPPAKWWCACRWTCSRSSATPATSSPRSLPLAAPPWTSRLGQPQHRRRHRRRLQPSRRLPATRTREPRGASQSRRSAFTVAAGADLFVLGHPPWAPSPLRSGARPGRAEEKSENEGPQPPRQASDARRREHPLRLPLMASPSSYVTPRLTWPSRRGRRWDSA